MAILTPLRSFFPPTTLLLPTPPLSFNRRFTLSMKSNSNSKPQITHQSIMSNNGGTAIVWFKHDLRIDDHPGIVAASSHSSVVPLYVFDPRLLSRFPDEMVELVLLAVEDLRKSLKERGSNLMIRFGIVENVLRDLVKEIKATVLFVEEELEYDLRTLIATVEEILAADSVQDQKPMVELWRTSLYDVKNLDDLPAFYKDMKKPQHDSSSLFSCSSLPSFDTELDWGYLPTIDDVGKFLESHAKKGKEQWHSIKHTSAEAAFRMDHAKLFESQSPLLKESRLSELESIYQNSHGTQRKRLKNSVFLTNEGNIVAGGTEVVLNALAGYLRYLEGTTRDDWQEVHQRLRETEIRTGASFGALFGPALQLGIISSRRAYYEAIRYEKERNAGFLSPLGYSTTTVDAAINAICSIEWYRLLSLKRLSGKEEQYCTRLWRWNGNLIQYTVAGHEGPAVLLVHGFGAFFEHYRDNLSDIADGGNRVWALTLLGFGQSEKPNIVYSELMWAELLRDFIIEVVGEQAHLVGNSIGGYFISIVGGLWPSLVKSIALVNTAGDVLPGYSSLLFFKERTISGAAWFGSRALLQYLRFSTRNLVKNCYPTRPERADDWLITEMLRASYDPGTIAVLESVFSFNLSIPLNHLLSKFKGKVLVIQGMNDPIADSGSKLAMFREHCEGIEIEELDAGHCPHDECPEEVNTMICKWISTIESRIYTENASISSSCI
ncbi:Cryptochrome DASH chloroplastic/mitochondrial [Bienertia sinuspersici]